MNTKLELISRIIIGIGIAMVVGGFVLSFVELDKIYSFFNCADSSAVCSDKVNHIGHNSIALNRIRIAGIVITLAGGVLFAKAEGRLNIRTQK